MLFGRYPFFGGLEKQRKSAKWFVCVMYVGPSYAARGELYADTRCPEGRMGFSSNSSMPKCKICSPHYMYCLGEVIELISV